MKTNESDDRSANMPVTAEEIGFAPESMSACPACGRQNAPNRLKCMYCAAALSVAEDMRGEVKLPLRRLEAWEAGWNIFVLPGPVTSEASRQAAAILSADVQEIRSILEANGPMPVARVESSAEADLLVERLNSAGLKTVTAADDLLAGDHPPQRTRAIEFDAESIILTPFGSSTAVSVALESVALIVAGTVRESRTEATAVRKKRSNLPADETLSYSDEMLIDIYSADSAAGWRVRESGFDFSCLGPEKSLIARHNMRALITKIALHCPSAKVDTRFEHVEQLLGLVWEPEQKKESQGLQRRSLGKLNLVSTNVVSNLVQFTKYSRSLRHLL